MKRLLFIVVCLACFTLIQPVNAYPTLAGPSGTGVLPTAGAYNPKGTVAYANATVDQYRYDQLRDASLLRYTFGFHRFEFGYGSDLATVQIPQDLYNNNNDNNNSGPLTDDHNLDTVLEEFVGQICFAILSSVLVDSYAYANDRQFNAKYCLKDATHGDGVAIGYRYGQNDLLTTMPSYTNQVYLVSTTTLAGGRKGSPLLRGTLGINWTNRIMSAHDGNAIRPFTGVEIDMSDVVSLAADYQLAQAPLDAAPLYSVSLHTRPLRNMSVDFGVTNLARDGVSGTHDTNIFTGLSLIFDAR